MTLVADPENRGLAARLNQVARLASGDVVLRMDADDLMHPQKIERTLAGLRRHEVEVLGGRAWAIDAQTQVVGLFSEGGMPQDRAGFLEEQRVRAPTVAATRRWFLRQSLRRVPEALGGQGHVASCVSTYQVRQARRGAAVLPAGGPQCGQAGEGREPSSPAAATTRTTSSWGRHGPRRRWRRRTSSRRRSPASTAWAGSPSSCGAR